MKYVAQGVWGGRYRAHMAFSRAQKHQWLNALRDARFVLDALRHQTSAAPRPNTFTRSTRAGMWQLQPGDLVRKFDAESPTQDPTLTAALSDAVNEVRGFLNHPQPWTTSQVAEDLTRAVPVIDAAMGAQPCRRSACSGNRRTPQHLMCTSTVKHYRAVIRRHLGYIGNPSKITDIQMVHP